MTRRMVTLKWVAVMATLSSFLFVFACGDDTNPDPCVGTSCSQQDSGTPDQGNPVLDGEVMPDQPKVDNCPQPVGTVTCVNGEHYGSAVSPTLQWKSPAGKKCSHVNAPRDGKDLYFRREVCRINGKPL